MRNETLKLQAITRGAFDKSLPYIHHINLAFIKLFN